LHGLSPSCYIKYFTLSELEEAFNAHNVFLYKINILTPISTCTYLRFHLLEYLLHLLLNTLPRRLLNCHIRPLHLHLRMSRLKLPASSTLPPLPERVFSPVLPHIRIPHPVSSNPSSRHFKSPDIFGPSRRFKCSLLLRPAASNESHSPASSKPSNPSSIFSPIPPHLRTHHPVSSNPSSRRFKSPDVFGLSHRFKCSVHPPASSNPPPTTSNPRCLQPHPSTSSNPSSCLFESILPPLQIPQRLWSVPPVQIFSPILRHPQIHLPPLQIPRRPQPHPHASSNPSRFEFLLPRITLPASSVHLNPPAASSNPSSRSTFPRLQLHSLSRRLSMPSVFAAFE